MKILITGSNGLVGQKLVELAKNRFEILACSRSENKIKDKTAYQFELLDISQLSEVEYVVSKFQPDCIINTAAITQVDYCEENKDECWETNVEAVKSLVFVANKYQVHFVHFSTDFVYDGQRSPYDEEAVQNPLSCYGLSKQASEDFVKQNANSYAIIRTILVYGFNPSMVRSNIVLWVKNHLEQKKSIRVITDQFRTPSFVDDLAEGCLQICERKKTGCYNLASSQMYSIYEIAHEVARFYKLDSSLISPISSLELNEKAKRPYKTSFNLDKAVRDLDYRYRNFTEGLAEMDRQMQVHLNSSSENQ